MLSNDTWLQGRIEAMFGGSAVRDLPALYSWERSDLLADIYIQIQYFLSLIFVTVVGVEPKGNTEKAKPVLDRLLTRWGARERPAERSEQRGRRGLEKASSDPGGTLVDWITLGVGGEWTRKMVKGVSNELRATQRIGRFEPASLSRHKYT